MLTLAIFATLQALTKHQIALDQASEPFPPPTGLLEVGRADEHTLLLHWRDGYVRYHVAGQKRSDDQLVLTAPLAVGKAVNPQGYSVTSSNDSAFGNGATAISVNRKTKGTAFDWFVDKWVDNHAVNDRPDYAAEHWLYVHFAGVLKDGKTYVLQNTDLGIERTITLDAAGSRSESLHTNLLGYRPDAPHKFGYLYAWEGDGGSLDVKPYVGRTFRVVDAATGTSALTGTVSFRFDRNNAETAQAHDTPNANFLGADVAECDFSALKTPGRYYLQIPGVGRSRTFALAADVYRPAFETAMKGLLGNRSGISLAPPVVPYTRPAPHNPSLTPGFRGKLKYTTSRYIDRQSADYSPADKSAVEAGIRGDLDCSGWYQDAGDWDSYASHIQVPATLMAAYLLAPQNFRAGELRLPDKPSALPDILKEAAWLPSFGYRLRHELLAKHYGTGGLGLRICGDYFGSDTGPGGIGIPSWLDVDRIWTASGEDPVSTFGYAGAAADLALCLRQAHQSDPSGIDWAREATESYDWATSHTRPGDDQKENYNEYRVYALCGLSLLQPASRFEAALLKATANYDNSTRLSWAALDGPVVYLLAPGGQKNHELILRFRAAILGTADSELESANRRALRWAGDWFMPMLVGQQTTPWVTALATACVITRHDDPEASLRYFGAVETTADYFLGTNPLNQTWVSGLGPRFPRDPFTMDGWYEQGAYPRPGIVPYGPWIKAHDQGQGPWDLDWANKSVYPNIDQWPGAERWFDNRCSPLTNEFTIWQTIAPSALAYGFLRSPSP